MLPIALMVATPGMVCMDRQSARPANRRVPQEVVIRQRQDMVDSQRRGLKAEGFIEVAEVEQGLGVVLALVVVDPGSGVCQGGECGEEEGPVELLVSFPGGLFAAD